MKTSRLSPLLLLVVLLSVLPSVFALPGTAQAQPDPLAQTLEHLRTHHAALGLTLDDMADLIVTDQYTSRHNGVTHLYLRQRHQDIDVFNGTLAVALTPDGQVAHLGNRLVPNLAASVNTTVPSLPAADAVARAAVALNLAPTAPFTVLATKGGPDGGVSVSDGGIADGPIPARLVYLARPDGTVRLAWDLSINVRAHADWWSVRIDAEDGQLLERGNWTVGERWPSLLKRPAGAAAPTLMTPPQAPAGPLASAATARGRINGTYRVYPAPVESPNHGARSLVSAAADLDASPFGWHDTDGADGADFTTTRGNNVHAYEDSRNRNRPLAGGSPDGSGELVFDFPFDPDAEPDTFRDAALANLFYWTNIVHDIAYRYGFDEAAGNFQVNNYGRGGAGGDAVQAEAQDGSGVNNANFSTPGDGQSGRMQMFLWVPDNTLVIENPTSLAGEHRLGRAEFGPIFTAEGITAGVVLVNDGTADPTVGCLPLVNAAEVQNQIALIDRGTCFFVDKVQNAQAAGAVAAIIVNNQGDDIITLGRPDDAADLVFTIPAGMIPQSLGQQIKAALNAEIRLTARRNGAVRDGDFDSGIIIHEYTHGITNRLTGGPANASCLIHEEQAGEGWSDWLALALTTPPGSQDVTPRGLATFAVGQPVTGTGLRRAPYTFDMAVNDATYDEVKGAPRDGDNNVIPHPVGFVMASVLWDVYWSLVNKHGYDPDLYAGTGGNNIALQLVLDGLKLQPCNPGFVDVRDAILTADAINNGGANQCAIWDAFARRGLGEGADQGSAFSIADGTEDFTVPEACLLAVANENDAGLPERFALHGNYPNPFNPATTLRFDLPQAADVTVRVFDLLGREVLAVPPHTMTAGTGRTIHLDATSLASGLYLYQVIAETPTATHRQSGRMMLVR